MFLYIVRCADGNLYTGMTNDVDRRVAEHNAGIDSKSYTYRRRPVSLVFAEHFPSAISAIEAEKMVKRWSRQKKLALIAGDWETIKSLAQCRNDTTSKRLWTNEDRRLDSRST